MSAPLALTDVEKTYGALRPLRIRRLQIGAGRITMLLGFDRPSAEMFVNLATGTTLPDTGAVVALGRPTSDIADGNEWLAFVGRFGLVSDRSVLLDSMTIQQNLALPFDLNLDDIGPEARARVQALAEEVGLQPGLFETRVADAGALARARLHLARALAFDPEMLLLEHPSAALAASQVDEFAETIRKVNRGRRLTTVGLLADEKFARATGGQLLEWQPATGEFRERKSFRLW